MYKIIGGRIKPIGLITSEGRPFVGKEHPSQTKYEKGIRNGKIPCPYTCIFKNKDGVVIHTEPIPLFPNCKPKIDLFS